MTLLKLVLSGFLFGATKFKALPYKKKSPPQMQQKLFIIDDHSMLKKGLKSYLEENSQWIVSGTFSNSKECMEALKKIGSDSTDFPALLIVDIQLVDESGFDLVKKVRTQFPGLKIVMYSMYDTWGFILQAKDLGVEGYISKVASDEELIKCINIVARGGKYYPVKEESIQNEIDSIVSVLRKQEKLVFEMLLQGKSNVQIKEELFLSLHTVENYVSYLVKLTDCDNRAQMIEKYK